MRPGLPTTSEAMPCRWRKAHGPSPAKLRSSHARRKEGPGRTGLIAKLQMIVLGGQLGRDTPHAVGRRIHLARRSVCTSLQSYHRTGRRRLPINSCPGLRRRNPPELMPPTALLVRADVAKEHLKPIDKVMGDGETGTDDGGSTPGGHGARPHPVLPRQPTYFYGSVEIDMTTKLPRYLQALASQRPAALMLSIALLGATWKQEGAQLRVGNQRRPGTSRSVRDRCQHGARHACSTSMISGSRAAMGTSLCPRAPGLQRELRAVAGRGRRLQGGHHLRPRRDELRRSDRRRQAPQQRRLRPPGPAATE